MQDIHHHPDGGAGGGPTGSRNFNDRRSRLHHHLLHHHQAALKCPRCDSLNTKFCYYNNYNLSQPRHFCKNCRRYWTKGGVLRNVPVGGGCRKSKRSKTNKPSKKPVTNNSHSSSESTTTTTTATTTATTITTVSGGGAVFENNRQPDPNQIAELLFTTGELGELTTLIGNSSADPTASFHQLAWDGGVHHLEEDEKMTRGMIQGGLDPTVAIDDLLQNRGVNGGIPTLDCWQDSGQGKSISHISKYGGPMCEEGISNREVDATLYGNLKQKLMFQRQWWAFEMAQLVPWVYFVGSIFEQWIFVFFRS